MYVLDGAGIELFEEPLEFVQQLTRVRRHGEGRLLTRIRGLQREGAPSIADARSSKEACRRSSRSRKSSL
jgi:hypothetical protein